MGVPPWLWLWLLGLCHATTTPDPTTLSTTSTTTRIDGVSDGLSSDVTLQPVTMPPPSNNNPGNMILRKCRCGGSQVLLDGACVDQVIRDPVPMYDVVTGLPLMVNTSEFSQSVVAPLTCHDLSEPVTLTAQDQIFLLPNNALFWQTQYLVLAEFCVEFSPELSVQVCLDIPPIPRCCPPNHVLGRDDVCTPREEVSFQPPVWLRVGGEPNFFPDVASPEAIENVTCTGVEKSHRAELAQGKNTLFYNKDQVILAWFPPSLQDTQEVSIDFCVGIESVISDDGKDHLQYVAKVCHADPIEEHKHICDKNTCVRKCCKPGEIFYQLSCIGATSQKELWNPNFHHPNSLAPGQSPPEDLKFVSGYPLCQNYFRLDINSTKDKNYLLADGTLHAPMHNNYTADKYCADHELTADNLLTELILVCVAEETAMCEWKHTLVFVLLCVSCVFLAATLVVYLSVAELRERTNGRCLVSMVAAMLGSYVTIAVNNMMRNATDAQCYAKGFFGHVCTLAIFFWLNVMCYDMWSTLRTTRQRYQSRKLFVMYSVYAWGGPLLVGLLALLLDAFKVQGVIRPRMLENSCWFNGTGEFWVYLAGIISVLVVINLGLFAHVAFILVQKLRQRQAMFDNPNSQATNSNKNNKEQVWLFIRLFIVMGVSWIAEILSSFHRRTCSYWVLTDIINSLQGVLIFAIAVCNKDNIKKIKHAWKPRLNTVQKKIGTMKSQTETTKGGKRNTDLSQVTSEASRKTSVTTLPRKISTASAAFLPTCARKDDGDETVRKKSTGVPLEMMPMTTMQEHEGPH